MNAGAHTINHSGGPVEIRVANVWEVGSGSLGEMHGILGKIIPHDCWRLVDRICRKLFLKCYTEKKAHNFAAHSFSQMTPEPVPFNIAHSM